MSIPSAFTSNILLSEISSTKLLIRFNVLLATHELTTSGLAKLSVITSALYLFSNAVFYLSLTLNVSLINKAFANDILEFDI